jgi:glucokinase
MTTVVGVDLGGTKIQAIVHDEEQGTLGACRGPTPLEGSLQQVADAVVETAHGALEAAGASVDDIAAVGIGAPGRVDEQGQTLLSAPNLPGGERSFDLAPYVARQLGVPRGVLLGDVQAGITGEYREGAGVGYRNLLGVFVGTGVGGGIVVDGQLYHGRGAAGEIGHTVVKIDGARCRCGRRGCLEAYAGRASLEQRAREEQARGRDTILFKLQKRKNRPRLTSGVWAEALAEGDELAHELIDRAIAMLGAGIGSAQNLLDVEAIVIGGGLADKLGPSFISRIEGAMRPHLLGDTNPPQVKPSGLGDLSGATGAALAAIDVSQPPPRPRRSPARAARGSRGR